MARSSSVKPIVLFDRVAVEPDWADVTVVHDRADHGQNVVRIVDLFNKHVGTQPKQQKG